jgi:hypothetical protein
MASRRLFVGLVASSCFIVATSIHAQDISFEALKIADSVASATWENFEKNILPVLTMRLESNLRAAGATEKAAKVFGEEIVTVINKDHFTQSYAQKIMENASIDEQKQMLTFLQSDAGQKLMAISTGRGMDMSKAFLPLLKKACYSADAKLESFDRGSLNGLCGKL